MLHLKNKEKINTTKKIIYQFFGSTNIHKIICTHFFHNYNSTKMIFCHLFIIVCCCRKHITHLSQKLNKNQKSLKMILYVMSNYKTILTLFILYFFFRQSYADLNGKFYFNIILYILIKLISA